MKAYQTRNEREFPQPKKYVSTKKIYIYTVTSIIIIGERLKSFS